MVERRDFYVGLDLQNALGPAYRPIFSDDKGQGEEVTGLADSSFSDGYSCAVLLQFPELDTHLLAGVSMSPSAPICL